MKLKLIKTKDCLRSYEAYSDELFIQKEYENVLNLATKEVKVEGFRPGQVPTNVIESRFGDRLLEMVADKLYRKSLQKIIEDKDLQIAHIGNFEPVEPFTKKHIGIKFSVHTHPELPVVKYDKIKIDLPRVSISDTDIENELTRIAKNFGTSIQSEKRVLENGLIGIIDFIGRKDGVVVDSACGSGYKLEIGSNTFVPGFEEQLIGLEIGSDRTITVRFPKEYHSPDFADKDIEFDVSLKAIEEKKDAVIDDNFAKSMGFESLNQLQNRIKDDISSSCSKEVSRYARAIVDDVIRNKYCDIKVPGVFFDPEFTRVKNIMTESNKTKSEKEKLNEKEIVKLAEKRAVENVIMGYIYRNIITENNFEVSDDDVKNAFTLDLLQSGNSLDKLDEMMADKEKVDYARVVIQEEKAFENILNKVSINYKDISLEKFRPEMEKLYAELAKNRKL